MKRFAALTSLLLVLGVRPCQAAEQLVINACDGQSPLAMAALNGGEKRDVSVLLKGAGQGEGLVRLTGADGQALGRQVQDGHAVFGQVGAGMWVLCVEPGSLSVQSVKIADSKKAAGLPALPGIALGTAAAGGLAVALSNSGGGGATDVASVRQPVAPQPPTAGPSVGSGGGPIAGAPSPSDEPIHPCLVGAPRPDKSLCGIDGPQPAPTNILSPVM